MTSYAGLSAANACNPVPGLDVSVDLALLYAMAQEVIHVYGLNKAQSDSTPTVGDPKGVRSTAATQMVFRTLAKYGSERGILLLLKPFATRQVTKEVVKWVPFAGPSLRQVWDTP